MIPKKIPTQANRNEEENPGLENGIQRGDRNIEEKSSWNDDVIEKPNISVEKSKENLTSRIIQAENRVSGPQDKEDDLYQVNPEYEKNKEKEHTEMWDTMKKIKCLNYRRSWGKRVTSQWTRPALK